VPQRHPGQGAKEFTPDNATNHGRFGATMVAEGQLIEARETSGRLARLDR